MYTISFKLPTGFQLPARVQKGIFPLPVLHRQLDPVASPPLPCTRPVQRICNVFPRRRCARRASARAEAGEAGGACEGASAVCRRSCSSPLFMSTARRLYAQRVKRDNGGRKSAPLWPVAWIVRPKEQRRERKRAGNFRFDRFVLSLSLCIVHELTSASFLPFSVGRSRRRASTTSDYTVLDTIGTGTFGICRRVRRNADDAVRPLAVASLSLSLSLYRHWRL